MTQRSAREEDVRLTLGVDPGSSATGYGFVATRRGEVHAVAFGVIRPKPPSAPPPQRLRSIFERLEGLLERLTPDVLAVESVFSHRNARSALSLSETRGVVLLAAARAGVPIREFAPRQVKLAVTGYGGAEKTQVREMVRSLLSLATGKLPLDASDALAIALCEAYAACAGATQARGIGNVPADSP